MNYELKEFRQTMVYHTIHDFHNKSPLILSPKSFLIKMLEFIKEFKITSLLFFAMIIIYFVCNLYPILIINLWVKCNRIMFEIISSFIHIHLSHLMCNLFTVYTLRKIEKFEGSQMYLYKIIYFVVINAFLIERLSEFYDPGLAIGYSGVLFGFITLYPKNNIFGYECKEEYYPFILLFLAQIFHERASFIGHLIGILSAYLFIGIKNMEK